MSISEKNVNQTAMQEESAWISPQEQLERLDLQVQELGFKYLLNRLEEWESGADCNQVAKTIADFNPLDSVEDCHRKLAPFRAEHNLT